MILVAGEALIDLVAADDGTLRAHPGGGPFNAARTIGRLEQPVAFLGRVSRDRFGAQQEAMLLSDGVSAESVVRTDEPTMLALAELDAAGAAAYRFYARGTAAVGLSVDEALRALPAPVEALHVGSLGLVFEPVAHAVEAVVERVAGDALVVVDPNVRPWAIEEEGAYRARLERVIARADVVKASEEDVAWLGAVPQAPVVLVTRGAAGATVLVGGAEVAVSAPAVRVVDTIGAGDAFGGAFVAWWRGRGLGRSELRDADAVVEAARWAALVAARTCERAGAEPPRLREL